GRRAGEEGEGGEGRDRADDSAGTPGEEGSLLLTVEKQRPAVLITGISGNLGRALVKMLHKRERIIGMDRRPFYGKPKDVEMYELDLRKKKAEDVFRRNEI